MIKKIKENIFSKTFFQLNPNRSILILRDDKSQWVLNKIKKEFKKYFEQLGINISLSNMNFLYQNQSIFYLNKYKLLNWDNSKMYKTIAYMHGYPNNEINKELLDSIKRNKNDIQRIWVTHDKMKNYILDTGINENKVMKNYISIDLEDFNLIQNDEKNVLKKYLKIPNKNIVIGSFQKDGVGWKDGLKPKLEKGPDIFIKILSKLKKKYNNLTVLLTGPSRGFVKNELKKNNIHFIHHKKVDYKNLYKYYSVLDFYLVTSREEGGPRSILESMASGIPVISSKVGQATELIKHEENGYLTDIGKVDDYLEIIETILKNKISSHFKDNCRMTAINNSYNNQGKFWSKFFEDIVIF